jgi:HAD superfamily hydrolase (TIGR01509 family)
VRHNVAVTGPALPRPAAIIFDLDGTLVDTVEKRIAAWLEVFAEEGIPASREAIAPLIGSDGKFLSRRIAADAGIELDAARAEAIDRCCGEMYDRLNTDPRPLRGVREALEWLTERRLPWAIATSSRREQVDDSVAALGLDTEPTIIDGSHVEHAKPAPDLLLHAARELGKDPRSCWYVGDSTWDMRAAHAAGMIPIGVPTGAASAFDLEGAGAAAVIGSLAELPDLADLPDLAGLADLPGLAETQRQAHQPPR